MTLRLSDMLYYEMRIIGIISRHDQIHLGVFCPEDIHVRKISSLSKMQKILCCFQCAKHDQKLYLISYVSNKDHQYFKKRVFRHPFPSSSVGRESTLNLMVIGYNATVSKNLSFFARFAFFGAGLGQYA